MALNTALNNEVICDLSGQPLDRKAAALLKAVDKLLTVGAYYSTDHEQYRMVSEKSCSQIVEAIGSDGIMAIEITASGMMLKSQLVDPLHRNVRQLHDLLVPLNIARFEISAQLTPSDLRKAIAALQDHKLNLGNTTGFQEIKIQNLPATVSTASKSVVRDNGEGGGLSLEGLFGTGGPGSDQAAEEDLLSESEKLASRFLEIVNNILDNLEKQESAATDDGSASHPDSTPENLKALREALKRLVEVNPDPADLARLIEHAKRALDLSRDPRSVDLVFSLLKKEVENGGDWKAKAREKSRNNPGEDFKLSLEELGLKVFSLASAGRAPAPPRASSLTSFLGICLHLLEGELSVALESSLGLGLSHAITEEEITPRDLGVLSSAVASAARHNNAGGLDKMLPVLCEPLRVTRPDLLAGFWNDLWKTLDPSNRAVIWPHMVNDLLLGMKNVPREVTDNLWLAAGGIDSRLALGLISRLECTQALRTKSVDPGLIRLPLNSVYPVHLVLMKSSLAPVHGPRIHEHLRRHPPNGLTKILIKSLNQYDPVNNGFYLSLIKQCGESSVSPDLRIKMADIISSAVNGLPSSGRGRGWVARAIAWIGKLGPERSLPLLNRICCEKKFFFFPAWPHECREVARNILASVEAGAEEKGGES